MVTAINLNTTRRELIFERTEFGEIMVKFLNFREETYFKYFGRIIFSEFRQKDI